MMYKIHRKILLIPEKNLGKEDDAFFVGIHANSGKTIIAFYIFFVTRTIQPSFHYFFGRKLSVSYIFS